MKTCHWRLVAECYVSEGYISEEVCSNPANFTLGVHLVKNVHKKGKLLLSMPHHARIYPVQNQEAPVCLSVKYQSALSCPNLARSRDFGYIERTSQKT